MDTTYRLTQRGSEVQELLDKVTPNEQAITQLDEGKVNKEQGKGLSEENFTSTEKQKLGNLPTAAELETQMSGKASVEQVNAKYTKPLPGIPLDDLTAAVQAAIAKALSAYQLPQGGIPKADLDATTQAAINAAAQAGADIAAERQARETADLQINAALGTKVNESQVQALISAAVANFVTSAQVTSAINSALSNYSTTDATALAIQQAIAAALAAYYNKTAMDALLEQKVNTVQGKQLSTEDFTTALKAKLDALPTAVDLNTLISSAISTALASYYTKAQTDTLLAQKQTAHQVSDAIASALTSYSTTAQMNTAITNALASYYTKTQIDEKETATNNRVLFLEKGLGKYDAIREITLVQAKAGKYVNVNGGETSQSGYGISEEVELNAGDILLVPSASAVPATVSVMARLVTRTYAKVISYTYTYQLENPELYATATADYDPTLVYTAVYDTSGETPVLTGWLYGGQTYATLPATHDVTEQFYEPLMKQAVAAMPSTGYYVYLCPTPMTIVISGYTATVNGGVAQVVGLGIFKNIATNFIGAPGQAVIAQAFAQLFGIIDGLKAQLDNLGETRAICINSEDVPKVQNVPMIVTGSGAPTTPNVPAFVGQKYLDLTNKKEYTAFSVTNAISDWVLIN